MEPPSPNSFTHEYFIGQPDYMSYESQAPYDVHVDSDIPRLGFNSLQLTSTAIPYYQPPSYMHAVRSPRQQHSPPMQSISPPLTNMSTSDLSGNDGAALQYPTARSTGTSSPASSHSRMDSLVHRRPLRQNSAASSAASIAVAPTRRAAAAAAAAKRRASNDDDFSDDDDLPMPTHHHSHQEAALPRTAANKRREEVRRQRIESEQRRRDELRDGYRRLKDVLPVSNQKSSKVSLLDRATTHIRALEIQQAHMLMKITELEAETNRLRSVNETLMLSAAEQRRSSSSSGF